MAGAIKGSYTDRQIEDLCSRRWFGKLCLSYKILRNESPLYLFKLIPNSNRMHTTRNSYNITSFKVRHNFLKSYFFD